MSTLTQANLTSNENLHLTSSDAKKKFVCVFPGCVKSFGKASRLTVHQRIHTKERPFRCLQAFCDKSYTRQFHLTRHIAVSHSAKTNITEEIFSCDVCDKNFCNIYSKKKHEINCHNEKRYSCLDCCQSFRKQQHLKTHSFEHTGVKPYKCNHTSCDKSFTIPSRLNRHALSHQKGRYICTYDSCLDTFDCYSDLRNHLTLSHPKKCTICNFEFNLLSQLKSHLKSHEVQGLKEAAFCPYTPCERYYYDMKNLQMHIRSKHSKTLKENECCICNKRLSTKQKLLLHLKTHDAEGTKELKPKHPRKQRKDKGIIKTNLAKLLSGYLDAEETVSENSHSSPLTAVKKNNFASSLEIEETFSKKIAIGFSFATKLNSEFVPVK